MRVKIYIAGNIQEVNTKMQQLLLTMTMEVLCYYAHIVHYGVRLFTQNILWRSVFPCKMQFYLLLLFFMQCWRHRIRIRLNVNYHQYILWITDHSSTQARCYCLWTITHSQIVLLTRWESTSKEHVEEILRWNICLKAMMRMSMTWLVNFLLTVKVVLLPLFCVT